jgi:hypothetical protein
VDSNQLNSFLGLPTDGGMHAAGGASDKQRFSSGPEGAAAGAAANRNRTATGAQGAAAGAAAANRNQPNATGAQGAAAGAAAANRNQPEFSGAQGAAAGAAVSNRNEPAFSGAQGAAAGLAAGEDRGFNSVAAGGYASATYQRANAIAAQRAVVARPVYNGNWSAAHAWAWRPAGYTAANWTAAVWRPVAWASVGEWLGWGNTNGYNYDYGNTVVYQGDNVYIDGQPICSAEQYYQSSQDLANAGAPSSAAGDPAADDSGQWLPLGVFGLMRPGQQTPEMYFQLAVSKAGAIRGNYTFGDSGDAQPVHGSVDKQSQRAVWTVGNNKTVTVETGLMNLTKDQSTALIHTNPQTAKTYTLVRLQQPQGDGQSAN